MAEIVLVVVGASAGGVEALRALVAGLPADLDAAVLVVLHIPRTGPSALPNILGRAGRLPASHAIDGEPPMPGHIYVAPADHHLIVLDGQLRLSHGPAENGHRPAIDPLFRSAAKSGGHRTIGVVLSGSRDDGTAGAAAIAARGGRVLVQDPEDALHASMPRSAIDHVAVDRVCLAAELGAAVAQAVREVLDDPVTPEAGSEGERPDAAGPDVTVPKRSPPESIPPEPTLPGSGNPESEERMALETAMADSQSLTVETLSGPPAGLGCPTCHGALFELPGEPSPRYRCWVGHAWSPQSLLDEQGAAFEGALWMALRSLEEKASLSRRMAGSASRRGTEATAAHYGRMGEEAEYAATLIRDLLGRLDRFEERPVDAS